MWEMYKELADKHPFLIMAHRGFWGGNIIQNTQQATMLAFKAGADIVEVDVCRSKDGVYFLFHDGHEADLLGDSRPFHEWPSDELYSVDLLNSIGQPSGYHLQTLETYLQCLPQGKLINIDRSWPYWQDDHFFTIIEDSGVSNQLFLKSRANNAYLNALNHAPIHLPYVLILERPDDLTRIEQYENIQLVGVEISVVQANDPLIDVNFLSKLVNKEYMIVANSEKLSGEIMKFMGYEDDYALLHSPHDAWGHMRRMAVNVIQTDWPNFLDNYRRDYQGSEEHQ